jgi:hypothetical protein
LCCFNYSCFSFVRSSFYHTECSTIFIILC